MENAGTQNLPTHNLDNDAAERITNQSQNSNRIRIQNQNRNQNRKRRQKGRSRLWTHKSRKQKSVSQSNPKRSRLPRPNPLHRLKWGHVFWQNVLPFLCTLDKFRLRAVNRNCKEVVETDFHHAFSIVPCQRPPMTRVAWNILFGSNHCATSVTAPVLRPTRGQAARRWGKKRPFHGFTARDVLDLCQTHPGLRRLDVSFTKVKPYQHLMEGIARNLPDLEANCEEIPEGIARSQPYLQVLAMRDVGGLWLRPQQFFCYSIGAKIMPSVWAVDFWASASFKMPNLRCLDLSRNIHEISCDILRELVKNMPSLREVTLDAKPIVDYEQGNVQVLADLWLNSELNTLTLTRVPFNPAAQTPCRPRYTPHCKTNFFAWPHVPETPVFMVDARFVKHVPATGGAPIALKFRYASCFPENEVPLDVQRYIPELELRELGVDVRRVACTYTHHTNNLKVKRVNKVKRLRKKKT